MSSAIGAILLRIALFLLPAVSEWMRSMLKAPPPPTVPIELHNQVQALLPTKSASQEVAEKLKRENEQNKT